METLSETYLIGFYNCKTTLFFRWSDVFTSSEDIWRVDAYDKEGNFLHTYIYWEAEGWRILEEQRVHP